MSIIILILAIIPIMNKVIQSGLLVVISYNKHIIKHFIGYNNTSNYYFFFIRF